MNIPKGRIHIIGIGGAGMSAIAKVLLAEGRDISGSDLRGGATLQGLADLGASVTTGHSPDVVEGASLVVASSAVPPYDEEVAEAERLGIPVWRRPELLRAITSSMPSIGATGTHGKTTTTALLVTALRGLGEDPSFIVGGDISELRTNGHKGADDLLVIEADEAFRTFESLELDGLVVTNVEHEHVDHFASESELIEAFTAVADAVDGPVVACADDAGSSEIARRTQAVTYGFTPGSDWLIRDLANLDQGIRFRVRRGDHDLTMEIRSPGRHMALNATGALALLVGLGRDPDRAAAAIARFRGVGRRWEHRGTVAGVDLYDDYAHHPTEVRAVLEAARPRDGGRLWAVFQPHLYTRTERFGQAFGEALVIADEVVLTDVYGAREEPIPGVTGKLVVDAVRDHGGDAHYVQHRADLASYVAPLLRPRDLVVSMGAGDITLLHAELAQLLAEESSA